MADHYVQGSFAFTCTAQESALIEETWQHASDLLGDFAPGEPSAEFLAAFMPTDLANPFNGLLENGGGIVGHGSGGIGPLRAA